MPTILETDIGEIEMPDSWSADQIKEWAQNRLPTVREGLKKGVIAEKPARIGRDVAEAGADVIKGLVRGRQVLRDASIATNLRQLGLQAAMSAPTEEQPEILKASESAATQAEKKLSKTREQRLQESQAYQFGEQTKEAAKDFYAVNPELENTIPAKLTRAAASTIPVLAAAPGGPVAMGATYAAMSGQQGAEEAIAEGRPDKADEAYLVYAGLGALSEALLGYPIALIRMIKAARKVGIPPKAFGEAAKKSFPQLAGRVAKESGKASVREALQESTEQLGQNIAARDVIGFDPDRERTQGVAEAAIYGGAVGGLFGGGFGVAQAYDAQPKNQLGRLFEEYGLDLRQIDPQLADVAAREAMRPENAQRTVVPAMLDQPATGWAVGEDGTRLSELTLTQPGAPIPAPEAEPRRRRPIAPATEPPRFRPPTPNVPTPPEETPASPAPAAPTENYGDGVRLLGQGEVPIARNLFAFKLKDGRVLYVKGTAHFDLLGRIPEKFHDQIIDGGFIENGRFVKGGDFGNNIQPGETAVDYYGTEAQRLDTKVEAKPTAPPMAPSPARAPAVSPTPPTTPVTQEVPSAVPIKKGNAKSLFTKATEVVSRDDLEAVVFTFSDLKDEQVSISKNGDSLRYADPEKARATGNKGGSVTGTVHADFVNWLLSPESENPNIDPLTARAIRSMRSAIQPQEVPDAIQIGKAETLPTRETPEARPQVGAQVREETPQAPGEITSRPTGAGGEVTTEQAQPSLVDVPVKQVKSSEVAVRADLMQFKRMDEAETGINVDDRLEGKWDDLKGGNMLLWEPVNPADYGLKPGQKYIVVNGHHRLEIGQRSGVKAYNSQVVREADGYSAADARTLGAEINIADDKGTIYDQAKFIRNEAATHGADAALARARSIGAKGRKAATIGLASTDSLFEAFINERISKDHAEAIARTAPNDEALQRVGIQSALRGKSPAEVSNLMQAVRSSTGGQAQQVDLFGADDSALRTAEAMASEASRIQNEISEQIRAVQGAAKRPEQAAKLGVDVKDPASVLAKLEQLKAEREAWNNWSVRPELVERVRENLRTAETPTLRSGERQGDLLSKQTEDLTLVGQKGTDFARVEAERKAAEQRAEEAKKLAADKQRTMFSVTLKEPTGPTVGLQDVLNAFPSEQGFAVRPTDITWSDGEQSQGFLVRLPNGQAILVDPSRDRINFDPEEVAADWGLDPKIVAERGKARGSFLANGVKIEGLSGIGLIELINTAGPSTLSHEKFHALFEMALTQEDRKSILDRYKTEEKAAEAFRRSEGFTRGFWDKMRQFIERLANLFRGDAFAKLRAPLSPDFVPQPIAQGRKYSIEEIYRSRETLEDYIRKPFVSPEEAANIRQQARARAALVPDAIAAEIRGLNAADPIEKRMASLLDFVLRMHGLAPALEIQRILADTSIAPELKDAAISAVLRAIEHVRVQTTEVDDQLQQAMANLARMTKAMRKISGKQLIEAKAKETAGRLITGYRAYLTAQAATMPADSNLAAARQQVIRNLQATLNRDEKQSPDATMRALQAIAKRIAELPVAQGPEAVIEAIRSKNILKGVVGDSTIDMLLDEKPGGIAPLLLNLQTNEMLVQLADLQKKAETYAKQIETVEQAFRGKGEVTPVELKRFAETYRKFRNKQTDAAKAIAEMDKDFKKADESVQVYTRTKDILERLQNDPLFKDQLEAVANIPGGHIFNDIMSADPETRIKIYTSPLKQVDVDGKVTQNEYRVLLAPDRQADEQTMREMALLVHEIEEYLAGEVEPIERRTLTELRDYIRKYQLIPMFATNVPGWSFETGHGIIDLNPLSWVQVIAGGRARAPRSEMEKMTLRAADMANTAFRVGDQSLNGYRLNRNNREYGDEVTKIAVLDAVKSHGWDNTRIDHWNEWVLNPILASGQAPGQMRLGVGDYIPGTGIKITKEDMVAARLEKRFSQAIVQTTQGTAQNLPPLLKDNPILIEDEFAGRKTLRAALGTGPLTMARRFSEWARTFSHLWTNATAEGRRRMITDGRQFRLAALGYVTTTNPEFENQSPLKPVYEEYTARARTEEDAQVQSLDHLIEQLAEIAVAKGIFPDTATAFPQIEQTLLQEIDQAVKAFNAQIVEQGHEGNTPQEVVAIASAKNSFTTARHRMVAPDTFYDYTLTSANDRIAFTAGAYQMFQSKQISALQDLRKALDIDLGMLEQKIADLKATGVPQSRAYREVQKQTKLEQEKGERRFTYMRLLQHKRTIDKMVDDLSKLVIDVRDPNDAAALLALSRFQSTMSSSLLASPMAIANNFFGGGVAAAWVTQQNLGRARLRLPFKAAVNLVSVLPKRLLATYPSKTLIGKLARSNMPMVRQMAQLLEETIANEIYFNTEAESWGLRAPPDMRNRLKAAKELPGTAGQIIWGKTPLIGGVFNRLESIPILRQLLIRLRDVSPRVIDEVVNRATADIHRSETFGWLKLRAVEAFKAREELAKKTGANLADFTNQDNLLTPQELGLPKSSGYRDIGRMRQLFQLVGNLDSFLLDYYNRHKAAPEGEKANVPLFTDPAAEGSVLFDMEAHGNIPTTGFTPPSMAGVGQSGVIKRLLFMFKNYVLRMGSQLERLPEKNLRDPKGWREAYGFWSIFLALAVFLFSGLLATETGVPLTRVVTGRAPSRVTAANVMADPDAAIVARYAGMALANNFPYYGGVISEMLGNPGYGSWWDAANLIPAAGLVRDSSIAIKRIGQTGDPVFPALDFLGRWLPPASPAIRLWPGMEGDIQAKNAARALRVVGPSEGMELAGGGGGTYAQTPVTPEIRRLIAAAYQGDEAGVKRAFDAAVAAKEKLGSSDPVRAVKQSIAAAVPARRVFGRAITEAEEQQLVGQMSGGQRETYAGAQSAFDLINRTLGTNYRLTSAPPRSTSRTRRRRRLTGGRRLPSIRRSSRSRRSPFSRYRVRRVSGRRRRRSPSFSTSA